MRNDKLRDSRRQVCVRLETRARSWVQTTFVGCGVDKYSASVAFQAQRRTDFPNLRIVAANPFTV